MIRSNNNDNITCFDDQIQSRMQMAAFEAEILLHSFEIWCMVNGYK
jgi:hypothetical protein